MIKSQKFTGVYLENGDKIIRYIYARIGEYEDAIELSQEVFAAYYRNMDRLENKVVRFWLFQTAKNRCIDYLRRRSVRREIPFSAWLGSEEAVREDNVETAAQRMVLREFSGRMLRELRQKNEDWFEIVAALNVQEMTQQEAAEYLGITVEVLRARLYRARRFLRRKYGEEYRNL